MTKTIASILAAGLLLASCSQDGGTIVAEGSFESAEVIISAEGTGRILSFSVDEGATVTPGQVLGKIDDVQLVLKRAQLVATQGSVESRRPDISVQVAATEQQLATARAEKTRVANLVKANAATTKQLDDVSSQVSTLERQLTAQRSSLEKSARGVSDESSSLSLQIAQLDDQIAKCTITSPLGGTVLARYAEAGELATAGKALVKVADLSRVYLRAYITAADLSSLKLGDNVRVRADFGKAGNRFYSGKVAWISEKAEFTPKTVQTRDDRMATVYAVKVAVENDGYLKLGMYGALVEGN